MKKRSIIIKVIAGVFAAFVIFMLLTFDTLIYEDVNHNLVEDEVTYVMRSGERIKTQIVGYVNQVDEEYNATFSFYGRRGINSRGKAGSYSVENQKVEFTLDYAGDLSGTYVTFDGEEKPIELTAKGFAAYNCRSASFKVDGKLFSAPKAYISFDIIGKGIRFANSLLNRGYESEFRLYDLKDNAE